MLRDFEGRRLVPYQITDVFLRHRGVGDDAGADRLAVMPVGNADDPDILRVGIGLDERLDLGRGDVLAAPDDDLLFSARIGQVASIVQTAQIAGV